jgi:hypothetical protein
MCRGRPARCLRRNLRTETSEETTSLTTFHSRVLKLGRHLASSRPQPAMPSVRQTGDDHHRRQRRAIRQANIPAARTWASLAGSSGMSLVSDNKRTRRSAVRYACLVICRVVLATPERVICAGILVAVLVKEPGEAAPMVPVPVTGGRTRHRSRPGPAGLSVAAGSGNAHSGRGR